jgi:drug/metabolite transporter (DMT)-like permease
MNLKFQQNSNWIAYAALAAVCLLWGTTFLALRIGVMDVPPFLFTVLRQGIAGILLTGFLLTVGKMGLPSRQTILEQAVGGFFLVSIGNGLVSYAEVHVPSSIAAIICSMMPVWVILINIMTTGDERPTFPVVLGLLIGLSGIILIFGENLGDFTVPGYRIGILVIFVANMGWAYGSIRMKKKNQKSNALMNAGLQMFFGGIFLIPASLLFDDFSGSIQWTSDAIYSLIYLIVFGSIVAYGCYSYAVKKLPMTIVSMYAYINPIVAMILGALLLNEKFNVRMGIAMLVTVAGIYIVNKGFQLRELWKAQFIK